MDKILVDKKDLEDLLVWRDSNKDLVRQFPTPFKAIEIVCKHNNLRVKGIRSGEHLKLSVYAGYQSLGSFEYDVMQELGIAVKTKQKTELSEEEQQDVFTVYVSICALAVFGALTVLQTEERKNAPKKDSREQASKNSKNRKRGVTYLLRKSGDGFRTIYSGKRRSPVHAFSVRGHYRHYKNGKVVWIAQHMRGTGKRKTKTYKI